MDCIFSNNYATTVDMLTYYNVFTAKDFRVVQNKVAELLKGRILVGHALRNDLKVGCLVLSKLFWRGFLL